MSAEYKIKKQNTLTKCVENINNKPYLLVFNYKGISANDFFKLRKDIFDKTGDKIQVIKNSISKLMFEKAEKDVDVNLLKDQNAMIFTSQIISACSILESFISKGQISIVSYYDKSKFYDKSSVLSLAKYKNEDGLKSSLLMLLKEPASRLARVLNTKCSG